MARPWLIITRPDAAARRFQAELGDVGADCLISPIMAVLRRPFALPDPVPDGLILTSENAAFAVASLTPGLPAWCVGQRTAKAAAAAGAEPVFVASTAEALVAAMSEHPPDLNLLHLRGAHARGDVARRLGAQERIVYVQEPRSLTAEARAALAGDRPVVLPLFSPRSATLVAAEAEVSAPVTVVAMSEEVASAAQPLRPRRIELAASPDGREMRAAVRRVIAAL
ncbi:uroporphyrinogen-III synthase [Pseudoroseicyclus sp. H15]